MSALKIYPWQCAQVDPVIGVDEVGRGCLAGPVFAAAVILNKNKFPLGLTDSKLLSATRRERLATEILECARVGIGVASVSEIETMNILRASLLAMQRAVCELKTSTGLILVDGQFKIPGLEHCQQECLVQGELRAHPIAAASIVAKVARDQLMKELAKDYPGYGFESHKGYGTKAHKKAIVELGVTNHHRKTFVGVTEWVGPRSPA